MWDFAVGQYGYVRAADAHDLEIPVVELGKLAARGQIRHVAYGLYRFDDLPPTRFDRFFEAVARVGGDAHLTGDAVLALHELGQVNPQVVRVGTSRRVRAQLPKWIAIERETLPAELAITSTSRDGEIMGVRHRGLAGGPAPLEGVQFHPESILTEHGHAMLRNFLEMTA